MGDQDILMRAAGTRHTRARKANTQLMEWAKKKNNYAWPTETDVQESASTSML